MINWCIESPARGKALEAYILAQWKGTPLEYGKH